MKLLVLFCSAGGGSVGYSRAGLSPVGVDIAAQPRYPFSFTRADALGILDNLLEMRERRLPLPFDAVHASPPCQHYSCATVTRGASRADHPSLIAPVRDRLRRLGLPYVIENVPGARSELIDPVELCGQMFGLDLYRHRLFEVDGFECPTPPHPSHERPLTKMGRPPQPNEIMHVVGNFSGVAQAREAMGIDWMTRDELAQAVPPAMTEYIGRHLVAALNERS